MQVDYETCYAADGHALGERMQAEQNKDFHDNLYGRARNE